MLILAFVLSSMVPIESSPGDAVQGAGILIQPQLVLTALHVVDKPVMAIRCEGDEIPAILVAKDMTNDLALLELAAPCGRTVSRIAPQNPPLDTIVHAEGCPNRTCGWHIFGHVMGYDVSIGPNGKPQVVLMSEAPIFFGSSGGPLYDEQHTVVGLADAMVTIGDQDDPKAVKRTYSQFIPAETLMRFLILALQ